MDERLPKKVMYVEMASGQRGVCKPKMRYKDAVKASLKSCATNIGDFETFASDRVCWRKTVFPGTEWPRKQGFKD